MEEIQQKRVPRNRRTTSVELNNYKLDKISKVIQANGEVHTICLSSMTFDAVLTEAIEGLEYYEMRCLWEISRVVTQGVHVHFFSKRVVVPEAINHFFEVFQFSERDKQKIHFYSVEEILNKTDLNEDLSDYVLNDPLVRQVFSKICNNKNCYLECFVLTRKEQEVSKSL